MATGILFKQDAIPHKISGQYLVTESGAYRFGRFIEALPTKAAGTAFVFGDTPDGAVVSSLIGPHTAVEQRFDSGVCFYTAGCTRVLAVSYAEPAHWPAFVQVLAAAARGKYVPYFRSKLTRVAYPLLQQDPAIEVYVHLPLNDAARLANQLVLAQTYADWVDSSARTPDLVPKTKEQGLFEAVVARCEVLSRLEREFRPAVELARREQTRRQAARDEQAALRLSELRTELDRITFAIEVLRTDTAVLRRELAPAPAPDAAPASLTDQFLAAKDNQADAVRQLNTADWRSLALVTQGPAVRELLATAARIDALVASKKQHPPKADSAS